MNRRKATLKDDAVCNCGKPILVRATGCVPNVQYCMMGLCPPMVVA